MSLLFSNNFEQDLTAEPANDKDDLLLSFLRGKHTECKVEFASFLNSEKKNKLKIK